jgi:hypothetical protein
MAATATVKRPRVIGILIILIFFGAILNVLGGLGSLALISEAQAQGLVIPGWITLVAYLALALAILAFVSAVLLLMYKRLGLILGAVIYGTNLLLNVALVVTGQTALNISVIIGVLIPLIVLYYIYIYLTREPEKSFFS